MSFKISPRDFEYVCSMALRNAAIVLDPGKEYLVETRLGPLAEKSGCASLEEYVAKLRISSSISEIHKQAVDALTTNETLFFRDFKPFEMLRKQVIPDIIERNRASRSMRIWCAASSTGQEPYSLAMLLADSFPELSSWSVSILATDISKTVLEKARSGRYNQFEVNRGLPAAMLAKYFKQDGNYWVLKPEIGQRVNFSELNLIDNWPAFPPLDLILVRNVLIYFDIETKRSILSNMAKRTAPHGRLLLGSAETTVNVCPDWAPVRYQDGVAYALHSNICKDGICKL